MVKAILQYYFYFIHSKNDILKHEFAVESMLEYFPLSLISLMSLKLTLKKAVTYFMKEGFYFSYSSWQVLFLVFMQVCQ